MAAVGSACLVVAFLTVLYAAGAGIYAGVRGSRRSAVSARRAIYCLAGLMVLATAILEAAYLRTDLSFRLVANNSSADTPTFYKLTAMWSSQAGSLMLWVLLLSLFSSAVLFSTRKTLRDITPWATAVLALVATFFLALMLFFDEARPFATLMPAPGGGQRAEPAAAPPGDDVPPADALHGLCGLHDPVRVCDRRPDHPPHRRRLDPRHAPVCADRLELPGLRDPARRALVVRRARAGAATGRGTRWRTRR